MRTRGRSGTAEADDGSIYLDLGDKSWRAVRLTVDGWTVVDNPPVHFIHGPAISALPAPERGGSLDDLRTMINLAGDADFYRVVGWLIGALRPRGPYPVLAFVAEQGSGKSASARFLRSLVDPSAMPLRGMPRDEHDLVIAARANHVIALDNISNLPQWLSDALCRTATGGGWSTRRLYTDAEEEIFTQTRPVLITGIEDYVSNADLLERSMLMNLPTISPQLRRQEKDLEHDFERLQPFVLGALLDAVCAALRNLNDVDTSQLPRMADFAAWVIAAGPALGWPHGAFLDAYTAGASEAQDVILEASSVGEPLRDMAEALGAWEGTSTDLLAALSERVSEDTRRSKAWPKTARAMSAAVKRLAPTLRAVGLEIDYARGKDLKRLRLIRIEFKREETTVQTVQPSTAPAERLDGMDGMDDSIPAPFPHGDTSGEPEAPKQMTLIDSAENKSEVRI